jgi:magnesium-transporting ATPase (P-type)
MSEVKEIPREMQRFILALVFVAGFLAVFIYTFHVSRDIELAKTVLTLLSGAVSSITAFFFGVKTAEMRP